MASDDIKIHLELPSKIFSIGVMETIMMSVVQNGRDKESERVMMITVAAGGVTKYYSCMTMFYLMITFCSFHWLSVCDHWCCISYKLKGISTVAQEKKSTE